MSTLWWLILYLLLVATVFVEGILIIAIIRTIGNIYLRLSEVPRTVSQRPPRSLIYLPDHTFTGIHGQEFSLSDLWQQGGLVLFLVSTGCPACAHLLHQLAGALAQIGPLNVPACVLCLGSLSDVRVLAAVLPRYVPVAAIEDARVFERLGVASVPTILVISAAGRITDVLDDTVDIGNLGAIVADRLSLIPHS